MIANVTCAFQSVVVCFSLAGLLTESTARNVDLTQDILGHPSAYGDSIHGGTPIAGWLWKILKNDGWFGGTSILGDLYIIIYILYYIYIYIYNIHILYIIYIVFFIQLWPWPWHCGISFRKWPHHRGMSGLPCGFRFVAICWTPSAWFALAWVVPHWKQLWMLGGIQLKPDVHPRVSGACKSCWFLALSMFGIQIGSWYIVTLW